MKQRWKGLCAIWLAVLLVCELPGIGLAAETGDDVPLNEQHQTETGSDEEHQTETESDSENETEMQSDREIQTETESDSEIQTETQSDHEIQTETESDHEIQTEAESDSTTYLETQSPPAQKETKAASYSVTFSSGEGYTIYADGEEIAPGGRVDVPAGSDYAFEIWVKNSEGYVSSASFQVKANGTTLELAEDLRTYTIANISEDQEITVTGVEPGAMALLYIGSSQISVGILIPYDDVEENKVVLFGKPLSEQALVERPGSLASWTVWSCDSGRYVQNKARECSPDDVISKGEYDADIGQDHIMLLAPVWKTQLFSLVPESATEGGSFTISVAGNDVTQAYDGEQVTVTPHPDIGYTVDKITVTTADGSSVAVSENNSFSMPASNVTVSVSFVKDGGDEPADLTVSESGTRKLQAGTAYVFGPGTWKIEGDATVYQGGNTFYVPADGTYIFTKQ